MSFFVHDVPVTTCCEIKKKKNYRVSPPVTDRCWTWSVKRLSQRPIHHTDGFDFYVSVWTFRHVNSQRWLVSGAGSVGCWSQVWVPCKVCCFVCMFCFCFAFFLSPCCSQSLCRRRRNMMTHKHESLLKRIPPGDAFVTSSWHSVQFKLG